MGHQNNLCTSVSRLVMVAASEVQTCCTDQLQVSSRSKQSQVLAVRALFHLVA